MMDTKTQVGIQIRLLKYEKDLLRKRKWRENKMSWAFVMFMNGYITIVDSFPNQSTCLEKVRQYNAAFKQSETPALVWCEFRPKA